jgi:hypothetical protein
LAEFHVAPIKPHLAERDTVYPALAEFGVRQLDPEILGGFHDLVDVWPLLPAANLAAVRVERLIRDMTR